MIIVNDIKTYTFPNSRICTICKVEIVGGQDVHMRDIFMGKRPEVVILCTECHEEAALGERVSIYELVSPRQIRSWYSTKNPESPQSPTEARLRKSFRSRVARVARERRANA